MALILENKKHFAYICPYCGRVCERDISVFNLPKSGAKFNCTELGCNAPIVTFSVKNDKYVIETVCTACGEKHKYFIKQDSLWEKKKIVLTCPETSVAILFFGEKAEVQRELAHQEELYREAQDELLENPELKIYFNLVQIVNEIAKREKVVCGKCGEKHAQIELSDEGVVIKCIACGGKKVLPPTQEAIDDLLETGTIVLE